MRVRVSEPNPNRNQERLERRQAVGVRAARRLANQGILRGWGAWHAMWEDKARKMRMIAAAVRHAP